MAARPKMQSSAIPPITPPIMAPVLLLGLAESPPSLSFEDADDSTGRMPPLTDDAPPLAVEIDEGKFVPEVITPVLAEPSVLELVGWDAVLGALVSADDVSFTGDFVSTGLGFGVSSLGLAARVVEV